MLRSQYGFEESAIRTAFTELLDLTDVAFELAAAMHLASRPGGATLVSFVMTLRSACNAHRRPKHRRRGPQALTPRPSSLTWIVQLRFHTDETTVSNTAFFISLALEQDHALDLEHGTVADLAMFVPQEVYPLDNPQTDLPRIAKDKRLIQLIEDAVGKIPTRHKLVLGDARTMTGLAPDSVHLVVTSPPYWTLKEYRDSSGQMGHIADYDEFLAELDKCGSTASGRWFLAGA